MNSASRPSACPFVAFDDDRDRRAETPDPRHRCFAVPNPEPRAIAHQAAYCLTPNFPSCAFFMDWAARAAAAPLPGSGLGYGGAVAGHESPGVIDPGGRPWAAPPPWVADPELRGTTSDAGQPYVQPYAGQGYPQYGQPGAQPAYVPPAYVPPPYVPPPDAPAPQPPYVPQPIYQPSYPSPSQPTVNAGEPEQLTALPEPEESELDRDYDLPGGRGVAAQAGAAAPPVPMDAGFNPDPGILPVPSEAYPADEPLPESGPLTPLEPVGQRDVPYEPYAADIADEMPAFTLPPMPSLPAAQPSAVPPSRPIAPSAGPGSPLPPSPIPSPVPPTLYAPAGPEAWSHPGSPYGSVPDDVDAAPPAPQQRSRLTGRPIGAAAAPRLDPQARKPVKKRSDAEWSKPRRFEAYPTLGSRMRLGGLSPVLVGAFVVAIVALLLFLLPGFLGGGPAPTRTPAAATATPMPTPTPEPTQQSYTVKAGDVVSKIARQFGLTTDQIACFNGLSGTQVDHIVIGQVLLIPPADYVCPPKPSPTKK